MPEHWPYVKQTWTENVSSMSAARATYIEEGVRAAHLQPAVRVTHSANQSIVSATFTVLAFNLESSDQAGGAASTMHDTVTNNSRLTCRHAGVYQISATAQWQSGGGGAHRIIQFRFNGTSTVLAASDHGAAADARMGLSTLYALSVNDYVECFVYQDSGGAVSVLADAAASPCAFMMVRVA